jgi:hypothetical protein
MLSQKHPSQKRAGVVAQGVCPELKPQYHKKKKKINLNPLIFYFIVYTKVNLLKITNLHVKLKLLEKKVFSSFLEQIFIKEITRY